MNTRTRGSTLVALLAAVLLVFLAGTPASAAEIDRAASAGSPPAVVGCRNAPGGGAGSTYAAQACFVAYGDQIWVYDFDTPYAAIGMWENQLYYDGGWHDYRDGQCESLEGEGQWGVCNKDFYEDSTLHRYDDRGSRVRIRACGAYGCSAWSAWWRNNN